MAKKTDPAKRKRELRQKKKNAITKLTGNPTLASLYRDRSAKVILRDLGIDITKDLPEKAPSISARQWGEWATENEDLRKKKKKPDAYPEHILRYAILKNRELSREQRKRNRPPVDEYDRWGFAVAYYRVVLGLDERTIKRKLKWDPNAKIIIYEDIKSAK